VDGGCAEHVKLAETGGRGAAGTTRDRHPDQQRLARLRDRPDEFDRASRSLRISLARAPATSNTGEWPVSVYPFLWVNFDEEIAEGCDPPRQGAPSA
jgi:hypothetical protein